MSNSIIDALASLNLTPTLLLIIGALVGYFRHQHEGNKVPGSLSIPKDLLKSTEFNKLWTLLYVLLLPLSWLVNVFAHAVYALMWLVNTIGMVVRWAANQVFWLWNQLVLGLGGFSFYVIWHYLMKWPYLLFSTMLSTFIGSFNWAAYKSTYKSVAIASLVGVSGFLVDDLIDFEMFQFSNLSIALGALMLVDSLGTHMSATMGVKPKGMRPTYGALIITAVLVFVIERLAQDHLLFNEAAGLLGGIVLGVSVVTWIYGIIIAAALLQFVSLLVPAYLSSKGSFNWTEALRSSFSTRWLKSLGSIALFVIAYNTLGMWIYENVQQLAAEPYGKYLSAVENRINENESALSEAQADLMTAITADEVSADELAKAYSRVRAVESGNAFWGAVPTVLRDVVYMSVPRPFSTNEDEVAVAENALNEFDSTATQWIAAMDNAIEEAQMNLAEAEAERNRINAYGITASEDGRLENGERMRFGMPIADDADNLKWRITNEDGDTISRSTGADMSYRFTTGSYVVHAASINGCGTGQWASYNVEVNESPESPLTLGAPSGRTDVCAGDEHTYTAPLGMDIYVWDLPSGAELLESDKNKATIKWGTTSGDVSVYGELDGETSNTSYLYVSVSAAPGASLSDEGGSENVKPASIELQQDNFVVLLEEGNQLVEAAQSALEVAEQEKQDFESYALNESTKLSAKLMDLQKRVSGNMLQFIMNWLGKAMFLFVACILLAVALNFVVLWTAKYFGTLYDLNQKGPTYFRSTLDDYQQRFDGFPYLGLFVLVVMVVVGATAGMDGFQGIMDTLESGSFPTVNDVVQR